MIEIWFQGHAQTHDNVARVASGHRDVELTDVGRESASTELRARYADERFDVVVSSDTKRASETARLIFAQHDVPFEHDARLRECDYGDLTGHPQSEIAAFREGGPSQPFPNGESYVQVADRMGAFLEELAAQRDGQRIMIVGHRATFWTLRHFVDGVPLADAIAEAPTQGLAFHYEPTRWSD